GSYKILPDLSVGLVATVQSGLPAECMGYFGPEGIGDPVGYNNHGSSNYHMCLGQVVHAGSSNPLAGHTPWLHQYDLNIRYSPRQFDNRLTAKLIVYNLTNEQKGTVWNAGLAT